MREEVAAVMGGKWRMLRPSATAPELWRAQAGRAATAGAAANSFSDSDVDEDDEEEDGSNTDNSGDVPSTQHDATSSVSARAVRGNSAGTGSNVASTRSAADAATLLAHTGRDFGWAVVLTVWKRFEPWTYDVDVLVPVAGTITVAPPPSSQQLDAGPAPPAVTVPLPVEPGWLQRLAASAFHATANTGAAVNAIANADAAVSGLSLSQLQARAQSAQASSVRYDVVRVSLPMLHKVSAVRVALPADVRGAAEQAAVFEAVALAHRAHAAAGLPGALPLLSPFDDMGVDPRGFNLAALARAAAAVAAAREVPLARKVRAALAGHGRVTLQSGGALVGALAGAGAEGGSGAKGKGLAEPFATVRVPALSKTPATATAVDSRVNASAHDASDTASVVAAVASREKRFREADSADANAQAAADADACGTTGVESAEAHAEQNDAKKSPMNMSVRATDDGAAANAGETDVQLPAPTAATSVTVSSSSSSSSAVTVSTLDALAAAHGLVSAATAGSLAHALRRAAALTEAAQSGVFGVNQTTQITAQQRARFAAGSSSSSSTAPSSGPAGSAAALQAALSSPLAHAALTGPASGSGDSASSSSSDGGGELVDVFTAELAARLRVLRRLGYATADGMLTVLGRFAAHVEAVDELVLTELVFDNSFAAYEPAQVAALLTVLFETDRSSSDRDPLPAELAPPVARLRAIVERVADLSTECGQRVDKPAYLAGFRHGMAAPVLAWARGAAFVDVCNMTDAHPGSIVRLLRRLAELLLQLVDAARTVGNEALMAKFEQAEAAVRRGLPFASSLYTDV